MATDSSSQLFTLRSYVNDFVTGVCGDGRQVVMGLLCPHLTAYFFDAAGHLLSHEERMWDTPALQPDPDGPYEGFDEAFWKALAKQQKAWLKELGFRKRPIRLLAFYDERHPVGIQLIPKHLEPSAAAGLGEEDQAALEEARRDWLESGEYVWWWAEDYYVDGTSGEVEST